MLHRHEFFNQFCFQMSIDHQFVCEQGDVDSFERQRYSEIYPLVGVSWSACCHWRPLDKVLPSPKVFLHPTVSTSNVADRLRHWVFGSMLPRLRRLAVPMGLHEFDKVEEKCDEQNFHVFSEMRWQIMYYTWSTTLKI